MMGRRSCSVNKHKVRKGLWSPEEDEKLFNHITKFGVGCWSSVPNLAGLERCGKSCRLRWINYLRPDLKRGMFSQHEEDLIIRLHEILGNKWAQISLQLPGRTDNEIKNFWNSSLKKKLMKQGIDPNTHKPMITELKNEEQFMNDPIPMHIEHSYHLDNNFSSKSYDPPPIFFSEFQSNTDHPVDLGYGFNSSMPNLKTFDHHNMMDTDTNSTSKLTFLMSDAKESSNVIQMTNMTENHPSTLFWDAADKLESVFQPGYVLETRKTTAFQQIHNQSSDDYGTFQALAEANLDMF